MFKYYEKTDLFNPRGYIETSFKIFAFMVVVSQVLRFALFQPVLNMYTPTGEYLIVTSLISLGLGFIFAYFFQTVVETVTPKDIQGFLNTASEILPQMQYHPESELNECITYKPSWEGGLFLTRVTLQKKQDSITVIGPKNIIKRLKKQQASFS